MKITEYPTASTFDSGDVLLKDGAAGTKKIAAAESLFAMFDTLGNPYHHRQIVRGKDLGSSLTSAQKTAISNGTFRDLWIGDYWSINSKVYRIVDINYWYGFEGNTTNHIVVMPDAPMYQAVMDPRNSTEMGFKNTQLFSSGLTAATNTVQTDFGAGNILSRKIDVSASCSASYGDSWAPASREVITTKLELPSVTMLVGTRNMLRAAANPWWEVHAAGEIQLALFREMGPWAFGSSAEYWTRDPMTYYSWCVMGTHRRIAADDARTTHGVRPVFAVNG